MPKAQEYLNKNHSNKEIKELDLTKQGLEGSLTIENFPNLETIRCGNNKLTIIKLINLPKLKLFNANINQLTSLTVNDCPNITEFNSANNLLTDTNFLNNLNPEKLNCLSIHSNDFHITANDSEKENQGLEFLSKFTNLEKLFIDNHDKEKLKKGIYNRFHGSLQPLQSLENLKWINIANTDLDSGLEYLPKGFCKICLKNSWDRKNAGYLEIKWEMEKTTRLEKVTEKLQQEEENEPSFTRNWYRIAPWKEAREKYGEEIFRRQEVQEWLDQNYPPYTLLQHYKELNLRDKNLTGALDLSKFVGLEKLDCSYNRLSNLNLSKCEKLIELNCGSNEFTSLDFLQTIPNKENLEILVIEKNKNLTPQKLDFLKGFTNSHILDFSDNEFTGSLQPLENMKKLKLLDISRTDVSGGLEYLSDSCWGLYCDPETKKKSVKVADILAKHREERNEEKEYFKQEKYFNLAKWREELRSNIVLSIPTERLFVIRSNIKKFINKWGVKEEIEEGSPPHWYTNCLDFAQNFFTKPEKDNSTELSKLQSPKEFNKHWYWTVPQWVGRGAVGVSGLMSFFYDYEVGAVTIASPVIETVTSYAKSNWYEIKEEQWSEFTQDTRELLDNYHELKGILESLRGYKVGTVDGALEDLDSKSEEFLKEYDKDGNGNIDISELQGKKDILAKDLNNESQEGKVSRLGGIFQAIKKLEEEINKYRRGFYYGLSEEDQKGKAQNASNKNAVELETDEKEEYQAQQEVAVDLDKYFERQ